MTRKLKIYSDTEYSAVFLPSDVIEALGERPHIRQGNVYVWAPTAAAAVARLEALGLNPRSARALKPVTNSVAAVLNDACDWPEHTVLVTRLTSGGPVVEVVSAETVKDRPYHVTRTLRCIGQIDYGVHFRPSDALEPVVTDAMVNCFLDALNVPDGITAEWLMWEARPALAAALKAQRARS